MATLPVPDPADLADPLLKALEGVLSRLPTPTACWIGYSGGLDSTVLLSLATRLAAARPPFPSLCAVHVHHGLLPEADQWTEHCAQTCATFEVPLRTLYIDARAAPGESPEEAARRARYRAIEPLLGPGDWLLTAQHEEDQAETLLLQLLRGAGLGGLAAMPESAEFGPGMIVRPLLEVTRAALEGYARRSNLIWVEDPSNRDPRYDRNYLRHAVMPLLTAHWPAASRAFARSARHCAVAHQRLSTVAAELYRLATLPNDSLSVSRLRQFTEDEQALVIREWLRRQDFRMPSTRILARVLTEVLPAAPDKSPVVAWPEGEIRRYRDRLVFLPAGSVARIDYSWRIPWRDAATLELPDHTGTLAATLGSGPGIEPAAWQAGVREVRYRQGGERCELLGRTGSHSLKKLFQERGVPTWERFSIPLIYIDEHLSAVGDLWTCGPYSVGPDVAAIRITWEKSKR